VPLVMRLKRRPSSAELRWGIVAGLLFCGGYIFQTFSLGQIDSGRVGFITGLYVIMVPMLALLFLRHQLKLRAIAGASLAVIGLALLSNAPGGNLSGDGLAFLCALSFAAQIIAVERFPRDVDWRMMSLIQAVCVGAISGGIAIFAEPRPASIPL